MSPATSSVRILAEERGLAAWLEAAVLAPLGVEVVTGEASVTIMAAGAPLGREEAARALARQTRRPVLALLGRTVEDEAGLQAEGVIPLRWPHSPLQVQDALLKALGRPRLRPEPPGAPHIRR